MGYILWLIAFAILLSYVARLRFDSEDTFMKNVRGRLLILISSIFFWVFGFILVMKEDGVSQTQLANLEGDIAALNEKILILNDRE